MGHSDESARKICGSIEAKQGSSSIEKYGANPSNNMSQDMEAAAAAISLTQEQATKIIQTAIDEGATKTVALFKEIVNIEEEEGPPAEKAPAKRPPFPPR